MSLSDVYQSQIDSYATEILGYSGTIAQIDAQGVTGNELATCLADDRAELVYNMNHVTAIKAAVEAKQSRLQAGWTGTYATYVSEIESGYTGVYTREFDRWLGEDLSSKYTSFFTMYGQTTNDFQKARLLKMTFKR